MVYTRGSSQDYDRYAAISGDEGWSWDNLQPYIKRVRLFSASETASDLSSRANVSFILLTIIILLVNSILRCTVFDGIMSVTLPGYPRGTDGRVIQTTTDLADEFPFNLDMNSGYHLGVGTYNTSPSTSLRKLIRFTSGWMQTTVGNGTRSSSEVSYLGAKYINRPNLHVLIHTHVTRILQSHHTIPRTRTSAATAIRLPNLTSWNSHRISEVKSLFVDDCNILIVAPLSNHANALPIQGNHPLSRLPEHPKYPAPLWNRRFR